MRTWVKPGDVVMLPGGEMRVALVAGRLHVDVTPAGGEPVRMKLPRGAAVPVLEDVRVEFVRPAYGRKFALVHTVCPPGAVAVVESAAA